MKVLELTNYSAGGCGVWARAKQESLLLSERGHEVKVFSSNFTKGSNDLASSTDRIGNVTITRFPAIKLGGESFIKWDFEKEALAFKPDIIIAHAYRHMHTHKAIKIAKKINARVFLVTHAPFDRAESRNFISNVAVRLYDSLIGPRILKKFNRIIAITHWEMPYLEELQVPKNKIVYIPNGISEDFLIPAKKYKINSILFMGRIAPIKNLETVIKALPSIDNQNILFRIIGPAETPYLQELKREVEKLGLSKRVITTDKIYNKLEEIKELDEYKYFILPSITEGMPQVLIEALSRGKIVIASNNKGNADIIKEGKNGFLFKTSDFKALAELITCLDSLPSQKWSKISENARITASKFNWAHLIKKIESLF